MSDDQTGDVFAGLSRESRRALCVILLRAFEVTDQTRGGRKVVGVTALIPLRDALAAFERSVGGDPEVRVEVGLPRWVDTFR